MKDSGIPWIGEIPEGWGKDKIIRVFRTIGSGTTPKSTEESNFGGDINWIQSGDINGGVMSSCKNQVSEETLLNCPALKVYKFPFIIVAMYGASVGNTSISTIDGCVNQACCVLGDSVLNFKYAFSIIKSCKDYWLIKAIGGGQPNISQETIRQTWIPVPPLAEQHLIATFLDKKCSEIDSLIDLQEQMIEELKEYKQSVITEAVTKGLNPNVPMKDSGIEWFSLTPINWEIRPLKRLCVNITDGSHFSPNTTDEGKPYITVSDVYNDTIHYETAARISYGDFEVLVNNGCQPPVGAVLLAKDGTVGRTAIVEDNNYVVLSSLGILTPDNFITSKYLKYLLDSNPLQEQMKLAMAGSALKRITINKICKLIGILPSTHEQKEIADFLDTKCAEIDELITIKQQKIESLKEYKKSVIYEYVTGKKEP